MSAIHTRCLVFLVAVTCVASVVAQPGSGGASYTETMQKLIKMADSNQFGQLKGKQPRGADDEWLSTYSIHDADRCSMTNFVAEGSPPTYLAYSCSSYFLAYQDALKMAGELKDAAISGGAKLSPHQSKQKIYHTLTYTYIHLLTPRDGRIEITIINDTKTSDDDPGRKRQSVDITFWPPDSYRAEP